MKKHQDAVVTQQPIMVGVEGRKIIRRALLDLQEKTRHQMMLALHDFNDIGLLENLTEDEEALVRMHAYVILGNIATSTIPKTPEQKNRIVDIITAALKKETNWVCAHVAMNQLVKITGAQFTLDISSIMEQWQPNCTEHAKRIFNEFLTKIIHSDDLKHIVSIIGYRSSLARDTWMIGHDIDMLKICCHKEKIPPARLAQYQDWLDREFLKAGAVVHAGMWVSVEEEQAFLNYSGCYCCVMNEEPTTTNITGITNLPAFVFANDKMFYVGANQTSGNIEILPFPLTVEASQNLKDKLKVNQLKPGQAVELPWLPLLAFIEQTTIDLKIDFPYKDRLAYIELYRNTVPRYQCRLTTNPAEEPKTNELLFVITPENIFVNGKRLAKESIDPVSLAIIMGVNIRPDKKFNTYEEQLLSQDSKLIPYVTQDPSAPPLFYTAHPTTSKDQKYAVRSQLFSSWDKLQPAQKLLLQRLHSIQAMEVIFSNICLYLSSDERSILDWLKQQGFLDYSQEDSSVTIRWGRDEGKSGSLKSGQSDRVNVGTLLNPTKSPTKETPVEFKVQFMQTQPGKKGECFYWKTPRLRLLPYFIFRYEPSPSAVITPLTLTFEFLDNERFDNTLGNCEIVVKEAGVYYCSVPPGLVGTGFSQVNVLLRDCSSEGEFTIKDIALGLDTSSEPLMRVKFRQPISVQFGYRESPADDERYRIACLQTIGNIRQLIQSFTTADEHTVATRLSPSTDVGVDAAPQQTAAAIAPATFHSELFRRGETLEADPSDTTRQEMPMSRP